MSGQHPYAQHPWMAPPGTPGTPQRDRKRRRKRSDDEWLGSLRRGFGEFYDISVSRRWLLFRQWTAQPSWYAELPLTRWRPEALASAMRRAHVSHATRQFFDGLDAGEDIPQPRHPDDTLTMIRAWKGDDTRGQT